MALECFNCRKGIMYGHRVSHAKNRTKRLFKPNLHYAGITINGGGKRVRLCTKCLRRYKKESGIKNKELGSLREKKVLPEMISVQ